MITRRLPDRRLLLREKRAFIENGEEFKLYVVVGIDPADRKPGEIFIRSGGKAGKGSTLHRMLDAGAVLISHLLQRGMTLQDVAHALGDAPWLSQAVQLALEMEQEIAAWPPEAGADAWHPPVLPLNTSLTQP